MCESGRVALPDVREWWESPGCSGGPADVWECPGGPVMSGSGCETLPNVWEALSNVQESSGGPHGCSRVVE